ncbi:caspase recruitment domain-containing protein 8-like [Nothoprocta perdicaria]|uniref:caspase recruitment domain-containing protein 8-like n=1 Tax=Nothoprocta perdicaria TaxID=30464 RepID=UPI000E1B98E3|nr:caspase recruitment domain-containing protein 8-like [Nothoprocta perdicaria]
MQSFLNDGPSYRAHLPGAGSFQCSVTGLGFEVNSAVTIWYSYGSWNDCLDASAQEEWAIAGPLFSIRAQPGAVRAVHLPHFVCLAAITLCAFSWSKVSWQEVLTLTHSDLELPVFQAIERQEMNWNSKLIPKPSPLNPLFFGCIYQVSSTSHVEITPELSQKRNRVLLELVERKGCKAQEQLYRILREKDKFLISDLEESS